MCINSSSYFALRFLRSEEKKRAQHDEKTFFYFHDLKETNERKEFAKMDALNDCNQQPSIQWLLMHHFHCSEFSTKKISINFPKQSRKIKRKVHKRKLFFFFFFFFFNFLFGFYLLPNDFINVIDLLFPKKN